MATLFRLIRLVWALFIFFGVGIVGLSQGLHKRSAYREHQALRAPVTVSCAKFIHDHPAKGWFRITDCSVNATEAIFSTTKTSNDSHANDDDQYGDGTGDVHKVFVTVRTEDADDDTPAHIALVTSDLETRKIVHEMDKLGVMESKAGEDLAADKPSDTHNIPKATENALKTWAEKNANRLVQTRTIEGMVRTPDDYDTDEKNCLSSLSKNLAPKYIPFEEGLTPQNESNGNFEIGLGSVFLALGVFSLLGGVVALARGGKR